MVSDTASILMAAVTDYMSTPCRFFSWLMLLVKPSFVCVKPQSKAIPMCLLVDVLIWLTPTALSADHAQCVGAIWSMPSLVNISYAFFLSCNKRKNKSTTFVSVKFNHRPSPSGSLSTGEGGGRGRSSILLL